MLRFCTVLVSLAVAAPVFAQSTSNSRTTTTTTVERNGATTTTTTNSTTRSSSASFDANAAIGALAGAISGQGRPPPARTEDALGVWTVDDGGPDARDCRFTLAERGFLGMRGLTSEACPARLSRLTGWRVHEGQLRLYAGMNDQRPPRLDLVDGRFLGDGLTLRRPGDTRQGPSAGGWAGRPDGPSRGQGGWNARPGREAYAGEWRTMETPRVGPPRECRVRLTTSESFGRLGGSSSGCFETLMFVSGWRLEDGRVVLLKTGGDVVATLAGDGRRLSGRSPAGQDIVLYR